MILFILFCVLFVYNSKLTQKVYVNPVKIQNFLFCIKLMKKAIFIWVLGGFCDMATLSTFFLHFSKHIKNCNLDHIFRP